MPFRRIKFPGLTAGQGAIEALDLVGAKITFRGELQDIIDALEEEIASKREDHSVSQKEKAARIEELKQAIIDLKAEIASDEISARKEISKLARERTKRRSIMRFFFGRS